MPRTGGIKTKKMILQVAEELFAEKGFDGTSITMIAKTAGVNRALIYYHFKDKNDLIISLFRNIIEELNEYINRSFGANAPQHHEVDITIQIKEKINFLAQRRKILSVLLMESLKSHDNENFLFQCAEIVMTNEFVGLNQNSEGQELPEKERFFVHDFFTGFIPIVVFVVLQDKWCEYFDYDKKMLLEHFMDSFNQSHIESDIKPT